MFSDFQLAAIVVEKSKSKIYRIPLHQELQDQIKLDWWYQYNEFTHLFEKVRFHAGYSVDDDEVFYINDFSLPAYLAKESTHSIALLEPIGANDDLLLSIKSIAAFATLEGGEQIQLFQTFSKSHVISPKRFLFLEKNTYVTSESPSLTLDRKISALFNPSTKELMFRNFRAINTFLPLTDFYSEASEEQITMILDHKNISAEDPKALARDASQWFRTRFAMLKDSGILDKFEPAYIVEHAKSCNINIKLDSSKGTDRFVFPSNKTEAKKVLQFLNEEIYRGPITDSLFETNSKRTAEL